MPRPYITDSNDLTDTQPFTARRLRDLAAPAGFAVEGETGVVPASLRVFLDYVPREQSSFVLTVDGAARAAIPEGEPPAAGEVSVSLVTGALEFHASDEGESFSVDYVAAQSYHGAADLGALQAELAAAQAAIQAGNVYTVGPAGSGAQYATVQAALNSVPTTGAEAAGPTRRYQVRVHPGVYTGPVTMTVPYVDLVGAGANQTVLEHGERHDGFNQATSRVALWVQASHVRVSGLRLRNTYDATGANLGHATFALLVGPWVAPAVFPQDITVADCVCDAVGRDTVVTSPHLNGTVRLERVLALGYYDTVSVIGTDDAAVEFVDCVALAREYPSTNATWYVGAANQVRLDRCAAVGGAAALNVGECTVTVRDFTAPGPLYLTPPANTLSRIYVGNVRCSRLELSAPHGVVEVVDLPVAGLRAHGAVAAGKELGAWRGKHLAWLDEVNGALVEIGEERRPLLKVYAQDEYGEPGVVFPAEAQALIATHLGPAGEPIRDNVMSYGQLVAALGGKVDKATLLAKGDLLVATGAGTVARLAAPSGSGPWVLRPNAATATGLEWVQRGVVWQTMTDGEVILAEFVSPGTFSTLDQSYTFPANTLVAGSVWRVKFAGVGWNGDDMTALRLTLGATTLLTTDMVQGSMGTPASGDLCLAVTLVVRSAGTQGAVAVEVDRLVLFAPPLGHGLDVLAVNTTVSNTLSLAVAFSGMSGSAYAQLRSARLERLA